MQPLDRLAQFRQQLYQSCPRRAAALLEVIDAVAQTPRPHSLAELSLVMQRHWSSLYDALDEGAFDLDRLRAVLGDTAAHVAPYRVDGRRVVVLDHTTFPRPSARTVAARERCPGPDGARVLGHRYSWLSQVVAADSTWLAPLDVERIGPGVTPVGLALTHLTRLARSSAEPVLALADSEYGVNAVVRGVAALPRGTLSVLARLRSNLVFYQAPPPRTPGQRGRTACYGAKVQLSDATSWPEPAWTATDLHSDGTRHELRGWRDWRRKGLADVAVQVLQVQVWRADGRARYARPLWLMVVGDGLGWAQIAPLYRQRWRQETWYRQAKDVFHWSGAQLGQVERQDRWTWVVLLAYWQLLLARALGQDRARPWERAAQADRLPLARVQRDYGRVLWQFGLAMAAPKPRGNAPGRRVGTVLARKARHPLLQRRWQAA